MKQTKTLTLYERFKR